jgi:hypothetical protein
MPSDPAAVTWVVASAEQGGQERMLGDPEADAPVGGSRRQVVGDEHATEVDQHRLARRH